MIRNDIQCLRGIAILLVLLFHLSPHIFVNGFLGVDIFRRILPLYYLAVLIIVILTRFLLADFMHPNNDRYSMASLFLVTNQLAIHDQSKYFSEYLASPTSMNAFLHLWSLSVEIQFYLLVPFIFFGFRILKHDLLKMIASMLITIIGLTGFAIVNKYFAFNFMFLRLWQFSIGFMALFWITIREAWVKKEKEISILSSILSREDLVIGSISIFVLCLLPKEIDELVLRPLVTLATAVVISCTCNSVQIFQNPILCYIGDISYVLYLVHWPVIVCLFASTLKSYIFCVMIIFISSILLHSIYEKQYLKLNVKGTVSLVFLLIAGNAYLQYSVRNDGFWKNNLPTEIKEILDDNEMAFAPLLIREKRKDECETMIDVPFARDEFREYCELPRGNGTISVMLVGNSYVINLGERIRSQFNHNYSEFRSLSIVANYGLYTDDTKAELSSQALQYSKQQVELHKPDVLFVVARYFGKIKKQVQKDDIVIREINETISFYEKFVKKIYIMDAFPIYQENFLNRFLHNIIKRSDDMEELHLNKRVADREMKNVKQRFREVRCTKCHFFDLSYVFLEKNKYLTFDRNRMLSYVDNSIHLTGPGVDLCEPIFGNIVREIMSSL